MAKKIERECSGYKYTMVDDETRDAWCVSTDYEDHAIYLSNPGSSADLDVMEAYGKAVVKACKEMRQDIKDNRVEL